MYRWGPLLLLVLLQTVNASDDRIALVIGNSTYPESPLINPINDAIDVAAALQQLGFKVLLQTNTTFYEMEKAVREFGGLLRGSNKIGLFYYAGHGIQVHGKNYLIPVDADIQAEFEVKHKALDADLIMGQMEEADNDVNLLILDACRNNPFERRFRSSRGRGLAQMTAPRGTVIWYATRPGQVASDGAGRNSPFTTYLIEALNEQNVKAGEVIRHVAVSMYKKGLKQEPWQEGIWLQDFYFNQVEMAINNDSLHIPESLPNNQASKNEKKPKPLKSKPIVTAKVEKLNHKKELIHKSEPEKSELIKRYAETIGTYPNIVGSYAGSNWHITECPDGFKENYDTELGANIYIKNQTNEGKFSINSRANYVECVGSGEFTNDLEFSGQNDCSWTHLEGGFTTKFTGELQENGSVLLLNYKGKNKANDCRYEMKRRAVKI